jgi:hypothetical protein
VCRRGTTIKKDEREGREAGREGRKDYQEGRKDYKEEKGGMTIRKEGGED